MKLSIALFAIHQVFFNISVLCELAGVSRSGYYAWVKAAPLRKAREEQDKSDFEIILTIYQKRGYAKGARSIYMGLLHLNPPVVMNIKKNTTAYEEI